MKVMYRILPVLLFINGWLYGQEYNRSSVSLILMDYKDGLQEQVYRAFSALQPGDRYDRNKIATDLLVYNGSREYKAKDILSGKMKIASPDRTELLTDYLNDQNVGLQVIGVIFNRQADGIMNMEIVNQRAAYNKTDAEYDVLQATAKSTAGLREGGEALIRNSYIMVYDYANLRYEYVESKYESQEDFFWKATPAVYLFRVDFTDELRQKFYDECWMDEETEEADRAAIRERFATFRIPVKFVMKYNTTREVATGIHDFRKKSKNEKGNVTEEDLKAAALTKLITGAFDYLNEQIERKNEIFQVKTVVDEVKPVRARIGLKEGVKTDQRYFMYETRQDRDGKEFRRRMGVIRATNKITDNRQVTAGNTQPTEFYQIAGKAAELGWDMLEKKSLGVNLEVGYQVGNLNGVAFGLTGSFYGRRNLNHYFLLDFLYGTDKYKIEWWSRNTGSYVKTIDYNLFVMNIGYGYGFMKRNWELYPYIGAGANMLLDNEKKEEDNSQVSDEEEDSKFMDKTAWMFNFGVRGTVNIAYPIQAFGGLEFSTAFSKGKVYDALCVDKDLDKATSGVHFKFGLRYCF